MQARLTPSSPPMHPSCARGTAKRRSRSRLCVASTSASSARSPSTALRAAPGLYAISAVAHARCKRVRFVLPATPMRTARQATHASLARSAAKRLSVSAWRHVARVERVRVALSARQGTASPRPAPHVRATTPPPAHRCLRLASTRRIARRSEHRFLASLTTRSATTACASLRVLRPRSAPPRSDSRRAPLESAHADGTSSAVVAACAHTLGDAARGCGARGRLVDHTTGDATFEASVRSSAASAHTESERAEHVFTDGLDRAAHGRSLPRDRPRACG